MSDFSSVTEVTGNKVTQEQIERMYTRYRFASEFCLGKEVLEVACGSGQGLGYLANEAKRVVGGDIDGKLLEIASKYYLGRDKIQLEQIDAHQLPFENSSFDVVILYEAIYYLADPEKFVKEAWRVLRKNGILLICTANKDWSGFNPSPYSHRYFSASELFGLFEQDHFINISLYGDCPVIDKDLKDKLISLIKRMAVNLHIVPKTMKGKEFLKRIFFGRLKELPAEVCEGMSKYTPPACIPYDFPNSRYKVLYITGHK
jgi:ubiquinone/menaquinone biosynthesis C-methylase UbiE